MTEHLQFEERDFKRDYSRTGSGIQHQVPPAKYLEANAECAKKEEMISHVTAGCTMLASTEYMNWHNKVASDLQWLS